MKSSSFGGASAGSREGTSAEAAIPLRPLPTPSPNRRVIFPSLHGASSSHPPRHAEGTPARSSQSPQPDPTHRTEVRDRTAGFSPTNVDSNIKDGIFKPLYRASSLDGISIPLPKLPLGDGGKSEEVVSAPRPFINRRARPGSPVVPNTSRSAPPGEKWAAPHRPPAGSSPLKEKSSKPPIFGQAAWHKTYYSAASVPTPLGDKVEKPKRSKPLVSILRSGAPSSAAVSCRGSGGCDEKSPPSSPNLGGNSVAAPQSVVEAPTLASPASMKSPLGGKPRHKECGRKEDGVGESEYDPERMSDYPEISIRNQTELPRSPSNESVSKTDEEASLSASSSSRGSVSRHASLECLPNNKRISFDPHVTVYEFGVTSYEKKGGGKWFTQDELDRFKREAMLRIRLRSTKTLIPTGTGRALAVAPKMATPDKKSCQGVVSFNHPALGCEENLDSPIPIPRRRKSCPEGGHHMKNILVVDCHEVFLALFMKSLKHMVPHASVATAQSSEEAMTRIEAARKAFPLRDGGSTHGFDIIIVEERLRCSSLNGSLNSSATRLPASTQTGGEDSVQRLNTPSGSALIRHLVESEISCRGGGGSTRHSLMIGVSARLAQDEEKIKQSGADCVWGKPPPEMNSKLRNELLKLLMNKRKSKWDECHDGCHEIGTRIGGDAFDY